VQGLYDIVRLLFKRKRVLVLAFVLVLGPAILTALSRPTVYRARSRLMVTQARSYPQLSAGGDQYRSVPFNDLRLVAATAETLSTRSFLREVSTLLAANDGDATEHAPGTTATSANANGSGENAGPPEEKVRWWTNRLAKGLEIMPHPNAPLIEVAYRGPDPEATANVVNTVVEHYITYEARAIFDNPALRSFYEEQQRVLEEELVASQQQITRFQEEYGIYSPETQAAQLSRIHADAIQALSLNAGHISQAEAESKALTAQLQRLPAQVTLHTYGDSARLAALNGKVVGLELELDDLRALYTDEDRRVQDAMHQLTLAQDLLILEEASAEQTPSSTRLESNDAYQNILENALRQEAAATAFRARREEIQAAVEEAEANLRDFNRLNYEYQRLKAAHGAKQGNYERFLGLLEQARSSEAMDREGLTNVRIVDRAAAPNLPVPNRMWLTLAMGIIASLTVGVGGAFGLEALSGTVYGQRDGSERLSLPVFAVVPEDK
jgi:uncharacterized protein involved in exopolysaccharide biosynthesis